MTGFMTWSLTAVVHLGSILCPGMIVMPGSLVAEAAFEPVDEVTVTRGITGRILVESEHGFVRGRPDLDLESPILVRVANVRVGPRENISPSWSSSARTSENSTFETCWFLKTAVRSIESGRR